MSTFRSVVAEIHRRSVWQMLSIYGVASWMVYEFVGTLYETLGLPNWVPPTALVILLLGLPLVIATAVVQEGGPMRTRAEAGESEGAADPSAAPVPNEDIGKVEPAARSDVSAPPAPSRLHSTLASIFTWRRVGTVVVLALAGLGLATTGFQGMRVMGIGPSATLIGSGVLQEREPIVLADFEGPADDSTLAPAIHEALRIDLVESPVIALASGTVVSGVLARMKRPASSRLTPVLAREIAIREGWPAVLSGKVGRIHDSYVITVDLVASSTGDVIAGFRESASGDADVIPAVGRLSAAIREKIGESLRSIRASKPLPEVTTRSLDALRAYAAGQWEEAVRLDPDFAWAWNALGVQYGWDAFNRDKEIHALTRAYELRNRVTMRERGLIEAIYDEEVTGDWAAAAQASRQVRATYPREGLAATFLGVALSMQRDFSAAEVAHTSALSLNPTNGIARMNLAGVQYAQGKLSAALQTLDAADSVVRRHWWVARGKARIAVAEGRFAQADSLIEALRTLDPGALTPANNAALELRVAVAVMRGRMRDGWSLLPQREEIASAFAAPNLGITYASEAVETGATAGLPATQPVGHLDALLASDSLLATRSLAFPYGAVAEAYAAAGRREDAERVIAAFEEVDSSIGHGYSDANRYRLARGRAMLLMRDGEPDAALKVLHRSYNLPCTSQEWTVDDLCFAALEGRAYELVGRPDSAIASYERYLAVKTTTRFMLDETDLAPTLERLAALYEQRGDDAKAASTYSQFADLWADADAELQPRVAVARRAAARLASARGDGR